MNYENSSSSHGEKGLCESKNKFKLKFFQEILLKENFIKVKIKERGVLFFGETICNAGIHFLGNAVEKDKCFFWKCFGGKRISSENREAKLNQKLKKSLT